MGREVKKLSTFYWIVAVMVTILCCMLFIYITRTLQAWFYPSSSKNPKSPLDCVDVCENAMKTQTNTYWNLIWLVIGILFYVILGVYYDTRQYSVLSIFLYSLFVDVGLDLLLWTLDSKPPAWLWGLVGVTLSTIGYWVGSLLRKRVIKHVDRCKLQQLNELHRNYSQKAGVLFNYAH
jgi:hypothetical protein